MAGSLNRVELIGNLGADPETRTMPSGMLVANIRIATSETWKDKDSGEKKERTEWTNVALFGRLGEIAGEYLRKGSKVFIAGSLRTRKWQAKDGSDRYTTEVIANELIMLDGKNRATTNPNNNDQTDQGGRPPRGDQGGGSPPAGGRPDDDPNNEFSDSIPF